MANLTANELYIGQRVAVDGDKGTVVAIRDADFHTASVPSVHTQEKVFTVHFDDLSICEFREGFAFDEYEIVAV